MRKWVYHFDEVDVASPHLLGGKGASLVEMANIQLPVPLGFILTTEAYHAFRCSGGVLPPGMLRQIREHMRDLEQRTGKQFGQKENPLLVSVRSGSPVSMPGMMDTVLNLGLNDDTTKGLAALTGDTRFALDCYRRFIQMFGDVVLGIGHQHFENILQQVKVAAHILLEQDLSPDHLQSVIDQFLTLVRYETGRPFPQDPADQLLYAIQAVFRSWDSPRAIVYRRHQHISEELGTAVTVQSMVFGNLGEHSGTGVAFTRNPSTGVKELFGEYLTGAQGEDVVAGTHTPQPIARLQQVMPAVYDELTQVCAQLESHFHDAQDIEFTIERGKLFVLQTRAAKRAPQAAVKIAVDQVHEGIIDRATAISRIAPEQLLSLMHPSLDESAPFTVVATGLPASPGAASGQIVFQADDAVRLAETGCPVLLVRVETTPDDIHGILAATGVVTHRGGMTSHAAVVARGMGKPCVCGCEDLVIHAQEKSCTMGGYVFFEGDTLSIDGATGRIIAGEVPVCPSVWTEEFRLLLQWADETRSLSIRANADNPEDAKKALAFGAEGIGLCRTEHMFLSPERMPLVQDMILASETKQREAALARLLPLQQDDFYGILKAMDGLPVTIRLLDPPLHEFLPSLEELVSQQAELRIRREYEPSVLAWQQQAAAVETMVTKVRGLKEDNPMLGHRGCRLGMTFPEIYVMQVRALFQAVAQLCKEGLQPQPEVMIPLVSHVEELRHLRKLVEQTAKQVQEEQGVYFTCPIGTMIEVPRAALTADQIATEAAFFSFGTNDLTQTTYGFSRDDAEGKFLQTYVQDSIFTDNPFAILDEDGVGALVALAVKKGRNVKSTLKMGLCGEHGGEEQAIAFCHKQQLDYVSCSPFRVPFARLSAARAALQLP